MRNELSTFILRTIRFQDAAWSNRFMKLLMTWSWFAFSLNICSVLANLLNLNVIMSHHVQAHQPSEQWSPFSTTLRAVSFKNVPSTNSDQASKATKLQKAHSKSPNLNASSPPSKGPRFTPRLLILIIGPCILPLSAGTQTSAMIPYDTA